MTGNQPKTAGLTSAEAKRLQDKYGNNELTPQKKESFLKQAFHTICINRIDFDMSIKSIEL